MKDSLHTVGYAVVLATVCALLLTAANQRLRRYQEDNREAERVRNILSVLEVAFDEGASSRALLELFGQKVHAEGKGDGAVYKRMSPDGQVQVVGVPFAGRGRNAPIKGFLALAADRRTIRGITFYEHQETPGLGGKIEDATFRRGFVGKRIVDERGRPGIRITRPGKAVGVNEVDGITAATKTCRKVETMLNAMIARIVREPATDG